MKGGWREGSGVMRRVLCLWEGSTNDLHRRGERGMEGGVVGLWRMFCIRGLSQGLPGPVRKTVGVLPHVQVEDEGQSCASRAVHQGVVLIKGSQCA